MASADVTQEQVHRRGIKWATESYEMINTVMEKNNLLIDWISNLSQIIVEYAFEIIDDCLTTYEDDGAKESNSRLLEQHVVASNPTDSYGSEIGILFHLKSNINATNLKNDDKMKNLNDHFQTFNKIFNKPICIKDISVLCGYFPSWKFEKWGNMTGNIIGLLLELKNYTNKNIIERKENVPLPKQSDLIVWQSKIRKIKLSDPEQRIVTFKNINYPMNPSYHYCFFICAVDNDSRVSCPFIKNDALRKGKKEWLCVDGGANFYHRTKYVVSRHCPSFSIKFGFVGYSKV